MADSKGPDQQNVSIQVSSTVNRWFGIAYFLVFLL